MKKSKEEVEDIPIEDQNDDEIEDYFYSFDNNKTNENNDDYLIEESQQIETTPDDPLRTLQAAVGGSHQTSTFKTEKGIIKVETDNPPDLHKKTIFKDFFNLARRSVHFLPKQITYLNYELYAMNLFLRSRLIQMMPPNKKREITKILIENIRNNYDAATIISNAARGDTQKLINHIITGEERKEEKSKIDEFYKMI